MTDALLSHRLNLSLRYGLPRSKPATMLIRKSLLLLSILLIALVMPDAEFALSDERQKELEFFESRIRPVLVEYCYECHNDQQREGGLALDSRAGVQAGGDRQQALKGPDKKRNLILEAIRHEHDDLKMPDGGAKLSPQTIADFEKWFASGAFDPRDAPPTSEELQPEQLREMVFAQRAKWWALQPLQRTAPPMMDGADWPEHPIDRFTFAAMRQHGLHEAPLATHEELLRRLSFALVGLPPQAIAESEPESHESSSETNAPTHLASKIDDAIIDRMLASPQFGERWARHWMDWIRYAESHGSEGDPAIPYAHQYRDYLIRALNADVPYDQLVVEHLAGELLDAPRVHSELGINESAIGPAHLRMVFHGFAPTDALEEKVRFVDDQIAAVSKAFLGLTVACARCHDHKFDAIRQSDYYALFGVLGSVHPGIIDANSIERQRQGQAELAQLKQQLREQVARHWLAAVDSVFDKALSPSGELETAMRAADGPTQSLYLWKLLLESDAPRRPDQRLPLAVTKLLDDYYQHAHEGSESGQEPSRHWQTELEDTAAVGDDAPRHAAMKMDNWFSHGNGSSNATVRAGEFTLATTGQRGLESILPTGRFSHLLSSRHRNVLLSPRFELDDEYELWLLVAGEGEASVRYVVQDYPRDGTVYPVTALKSRQWRWQKYDLTYWRGDSLHVELATAGDAPVLARGGDRSWFGIRDARLIRKGESAPPSVDFEPFAILAGAYHDAKPQTLKELRACWTNALRDAVIAWGENKATDAEALWLDAWLQAGLLPNALTRQAAQDVDSHTDAAAVTKVAAFIDTYRQLEQKVPLPARVPGVLETVGTDQPLYVRGDHRQEGQLVPRGFVSVLDGAPITSHHSGRLALAQKLTGPGRDLLARVIVNRLWHHLFGQGLVATPDNFGKLGEMPSHPELLDYLAGELIDHRWSLKHIIRLIVTSHTWQQASQVDSAQRELDPDNVWLARAPVRRLEAEMIRDAQLFAAGRLDLTMYGPSVDGEKPRRSLYVRVFRNSLEPQLRVFDFPEPTSTIGRRDVTNVPAQSLMLMNNPRVRSYARSWALEALKRTGGSGSNAIVDDMFRTAFWRTAEPAEVAKVLELEKQLRHDLGQTEKLRGELSEELAQNRRAQQRLLAPVRKQLANRASNAVTHDASPVPVLSWEFDTPTDATGKVVGELVGEAELVAGGLVTSSGFLKTAPLPFPLKAKTLEVWVVVDDLKQRGGGVMSVQTPSGDIFDGIVLGEQRQGEWLSGSNFFARTQALGGPAETESARPIHLAIAYADDGRITCYRNGQAYGQSYVSAAVQSFEANQAVVTFGCRHLPAGGNKQLSARWERARLYDRALSADEVSASFRSQPHTATMDEIVASLTEPQRESLEKLESEANRLEEELAALGAAPSDAIDVQVWTEIAAALLNAKEFIFVK